MANPTTSVILSLSLSLSLSQDEEDGGFQLKFIFLTKTVQYHKYWRLSMLEVPNLTATWDRE